VTAASLAIGILVLGLVVIARSQRMSISGQNEVSGLV
jgi:hypothetical protein